MAGRKITPKSDIKAPGGAAYQLVEQTLTLGTQILCQ